MTLSSSTKKEKIAVLYGGCSAEREVSLNSGKAVANALETAGFNVVLFDTRDLELATLKEQSVDRVFIALHGRGGEDGVLQAVLDTLELPYTGSGVLASALSMDKLRTKLCWQGAGLETPKWVLLQSESDIQRCIDALGFPVIVKPALEGSSLGMSRAETEEELIKAWQDAAQYQCDVYAEAWVNGQEYTVGILNGETLPVIRLETPNVFYDFEKEFPDDFYFQQL